LFLDNESTRRDEQVENVSAEMGPESEFSDKSRNFILPELISDGGMPPEKELPERLRVWRLLRRES